MRARRGNDNSRQYVSFWLDDALRDEGEQTPVQCEGGLPKSADVVIVGGGFTGLWTSLRLLEHDPALTICIVEARYCGYGASGRNGGIAGTSWAKFPAMERLYGQQAALELGQATEQALADLQAFCTTHQIDAEIRAEGTLWAATNEAQLGSWRRVCERLEAAGQHHFRPVGMEEARDLSGSRAVLGGVVASEAATVQPAKLVRGLRRVALERGVVIREGTSMVGFDDGKPVTVRTNGGTVKAEKLILAMNAWAAGGKHLKPYIFVTSSDIIATEPVTSARLGPGLGRGLAIDDARRLILYWRSTPDGRIVFGKGGGWMSVNNRVDRRFTGESGQREVVESRFRRLYPELRDVPVEYSWNGPIDYSSTGLPFFGPYAVDRPGVLVGIGYSGMGVVQTVLGGRILASLALERDDVYAASPLTSRWGTRLPPEPFRSIGAPLVKKAIHRKEIMEDAGARPDRVTGTLARLDPTASPNQA